MLGILATLLLSTGLQAATLDQVRQRGQVMCGVNVSLPGFSIQNEAGQWQGMDVDFCRAVAAATLGSSEKVQFVPLNTQERFIALQQGRVDLLARNTTWNLTRDTSMGLQFAGVSYFDGQGFMVRKRLRVRSALELEGASVCLQPGTTTERNLDDYFRQYGMKLDKLYFDTAVEMARAFDAGKCDVLSSDHSQLYAWRARLRDPIGVVVLPEVISKEPLGPVVRSDDSQWFAVVKWTLFAMINAEELGVNSKNVQRMLGSDNPQVARLLTDQHAQAMGLEPVWARRIIEQVGNYGELYHRNVGEGSPLQIERSLNALWTEGGIMYAPPFD